MKKFKVFTRTWFKPNPNWPDGKEPAPGRKKIIGYASTEDEARRMCRQYNDNNDPGKYSRKAEYESI